MGIDDAMPARYRVRLGGRTSNDTRRGMSQRGLTGAGAGAGVGAAVGMFIVDGGPASSVFFGAIFGGVIG